MSGTMQQSSGSLEERDYIGLSEPASILAKEHEDCSQNTDLRLGLGLGLGLGLRLGDCKEAGTKKLVKETARIGSNWKKRGHSEVAHDVPVYKTSPSWRTSESSSQDSSLHDPPPSKGQVVGWPPVCAYRRQTLPKPAEMFVKVNMDGMTVGRKVDLNAYTSYESLLRALEEMFQPSSSREGDLKHFLLANEPDFMLTYEDKEGDWMLVGDVPWSMFTSAVRRLRIARGSEGSGTSVQMY